VAQRSKLKAEADSFHDRGATAKRHSSPVGPLGRTPGGVLPTGFATLDSAVGGGFARRHRGTVRPVVQRQDHAGARIVAHSQKNRARPHGSTRAVFDAPYASALVWWWRDAAGATGIGGTGAGNRLQAGRSGAVDLLVVDSAAALVPRLELESGMGDGGAGLHSRVLASGLRKLAQIVRKSGTVVVFSTRRVPACRLRRQAETSAGGPPLKLYASLRLALESHAAERGVRVLKIGRGGFRRGRNSAPAGGESPEARKMGFRPIRAKNLEKQAVSHVIPYIA